MKIVNLGSTLRIFPDDLKVEDKIPTGTYDVDFNPMSGYSLTKRSDFETAEKVYGEHNMLVDKMVSRYEHSTKNFGVILGGRKGTGKSLTARLVSEKLLAKDIPTIVVTENTPGLAKFLQTIEQSVFIFIDEFEKVFPNGDNDTEDAQTQFLSVLDGLVSNNHFYLITINEYSKLNQYFRGRTGRFYYDITFDRLEFAEINEYLSDNLDDTPESERSRLARLLERIDVNYDQLSAIACEINYGESIESCLKYLNLGLESYGRHRYMKMVCEFSTGVKYEDTQLIDMLYPKLSTNIEIDELNKAGERWCYDYDISIDTNAFTFNGERIDIDIEQIKVMSSYSGNYPAEHYGSFSDLKRMYLKPEVKAIKELKY